jgi:hypothetical protein
MKEHRDREQATQVTEAHVSGKFGKLKDGESVVGALTGARIPRGKRKEVAR